MEGVKISIVIPVLNEAAALARVLASIDNVSNLEVIVVDGGSRDETSAISRSSGVRVLSSPRGRACQMNAGAAAATGDILLFLHGDTFLPANFDIMVRHALSQPGIIAGAFELRVDAQLRGLRLVERMVKWRSLYLQMPYGDQAIFLKASVFNDLGGFPNLPIMEDFEFVRRLRSLGKIEILPASVLTSGRRWQELGVLKTTLINQLVIIAFFAGVPPTQIARWYRIKQK